MSTSGADARKHCKSDRLELIMSTGAVACECLDRNSWNLFCRLRQGQKILTSELPEPILSMSGAMARKRSNRTHGTHFVNFWDQNLKVLKSGLLERIFSTYGAKDKDRINRNGPHFAVSTSEPRPQNVKSDPMEPILSTSEAEDRKCLNQTS